MSSAARNMPGARKRGGVKKTPNFMADESSLPSSYVVKMTPTTPGNKNVKQMRKVFINTGVTKSLELVVGSIVVIRHEVGDADADDQEIGTAFGIAWPAPIDMHVVQIHPMLGQSHLIYDGDRVRLSAFTGSTKSVKELSICCIDEKKPPAADEARWIAAVKDLLLEIKYITEGMDFECACDGRIHAFTVISVGSIEDYRDNLLAGVTQATGKSANIFDDDFGNEEEPMPNLYLFEASSLIIVDHRPQSNGQTLPGRDSPRLSHQFSGLGINGVTNPVGRATSTRANTRSPAPAANGNRNSARSRLSTGAAQKGTNNGTTLTPKGSHAKITEIDTEEEDEIVKEAKLPKVSYDSIGGLSAQIASLREIVELPLSKPHLFADFQLRPSRGVLLYGPPGTGKTMLLRAVANETSARVFTISGPSIISKYMGEAEEKLRKLWASAEKAGPSIIFIDEVDAIAPKREADSGEAESRIVAALLTLMDGMAADSKVVVVGATNRQNVIDPALRRPGRFDREIEVGVPDAKARSEILKIMLDGVRHNLSPSFVDSLAARTHGFVGADLSAVIRESFFSMYRDGRANGIEDEDLIIREEHVTEARLHVRPSAMREVFLELPNTRWTDIGGQDGIKDKLKESVEWPLKYPARLKKIGIVPAKGVLLYGPPGCSKTLIAKALATEAGLNFFAVKGPEIYNKYVGEAERALRELFSKARANRPSIIFFDEIDALSGSRSGDGEGSSDRILTTLLNEIDGVEELLNVTILAATNRPDVIDSALMRPGRFDTHIYVAPPDLASRIKIFEIQLSRMTTAKDVSIETLARETDGCSGAEIVALCNNAGWTAMREDPEHVECIEWSHFLLALKRLRRGITKEMIEFYESFAATYGDGE